MTFVSHHMSSNGEPFFSKRTAIRNARGGHVAGLAEPQTLESTGVFTKSHALQIIPDDAGSIRWQLLQPGDVALAFEPHSNRIMSSRTMRRL